MVPNNDMLKTKLTETRSKLESAETRLFKIFGQSSRRVQRQQEVDKCINPNCAVRLASVLERLSDLQDLLAQMMFRPGCVCWLSVLDDWLPSCLFDWLAVH